jgi:hypothetical protein
MANAVRPSNLLHECTGDMMKLFNIQPRANINKKNSNSERSVKIIKTGENSWQIVYSDLSD